MGWASGLELAEQVWDTVREYIPEGDRKVVANKLIGHFEDMDCDTIDEAEQLCKDADRPSYCWHCDKLFPLSELDADNTCVNCRDKYE